MPSPLEDELGDILEKARDGKNWSPKDLAAATGISLHAIQKMERYEQVPADAEIGVLAKALDLDAAALRAIAHEAWSPAPPQDDPALDLICLNVYMGLYPVKCYLIRCPETGESAVVDTGASPDAIIQKAKEQKLKPAKILLTHAHPDHAGGLDKLDRAFACPAFIHENELRPRGSRDLRFVEDGDVLEVGNMKVEVVFTPGHTAGGVSYRIHDTIFSGDCIFAGSMGRANSSWPGLYRSITQRLFTYPDATRLHPGHGPATTVGEEKRHNPFFRGKV
ncbi:MBL fold metallo-hydrolase [Nitrospina gracilis]|uniref:MBL fold metallo-hydrolase n=1 Tax=Nitrospina gracilis TaxID=35801 RepID=UPI001F23FB0F|nr:MBL fold metallo-hydrolase [Nitrospina gracilis]MCF8721245.1 glyoxylase-like metal-dependent hydrolase (beta-lactamase superfamily II) [Nitrospina gracilis Nb-211]